MIGRLSKRQKIGMIGLILLIGIGGTALFNNRFTAEGDLDKLARIKPKFTAVIKRNINGEKTSAVGTLFIEGMACESQKSQLSTQMGVISCDLILGNEIYGFRFFDRQMGNYVLNVNELIEDTILPFHVEPGMPMVVEITLNEDHSSVVRKLVDNIFVPFR